MNVDYPQVNERTALLEDVEDIDRYDAGKGLDDGLERQVQTTVTSSSESTIANEEIPPPIPWWPVISIFMLTAVQPLGFELIFPFISACLLLSCVGKLN